MALPRLGRFTAKWRRGDKFDRLKVEFLKMGAIDSGFEPDRRFDSLHQALEFLRHEYLQEPPARTKQEQPRTPKYLFRGECGQYPATVSGIYRPSTYRLRDGRSLGRPDRAVLEKLVVDLARRFSDKDYSLDEHSAIGLLQHYSLPTPLIDFTCHLGNAIAFAGNGARTGRICVIPTASLPGWVTVVNLMEHARCVRPCRQSAFGIMMPDTRRDLKHKEVRDALRLHWYEFPVPAEYQPVLHRKHTDLVRLEDDPSGGLIRYHITEYVEANGKFSSLLTDWLLERVPILPKCEEVISFDGADVVIELRPPSLLGEVDRSSEENWSRRYWSCAFPDSSWDRMTGWTWPPVGVVFADPRIFHGIPTLPKA